MQGFGKGAFLVAMGLLAVACGASPGAPPTDRPTVPPPAPAPSGTPGPVDPGAQATVAKATMAFKSLKAYSAAMSFFQKNGSHVASGIYDISGKQPRNLRMEIRTGNSQGTKLLWTGGKTIKTRPGGLLSPIVVDLATTDNRVMSVRGYTIDQTDLTALMGMMADKRGHATLGIQTSKITFVQVTGPHLLSGCTRMAVGLDPASSLPRIVELSDRREVVFRIKLDGFKRLGDVSLDI